VRTAATIRGKKITRSSLYYGRDVRIRSDEFLSRTYLSPGAPRTEGVSAAGEEALAVAEEHLDVITTILDALALILTGVDLVLRRGPRGVLQVRKRRQSQAVQIISEKTHFIYISVIACSPRVVKRVPCAKPDAINPLKVHWRRRDVAVLSPLVASVTFLVATFVKLLDTCQPAFFTIKRNKSISI